MSDIKTGPVLQLITHKKAWGKTAGDVLAEALDAYNSLNAPAPFETQPTLPDMAVLARRMNDACDHFTAKRRKGMMISSRFRVEQPNHYTVQVYHVRNEHDPDLFLTFKRKTNEVW